MITDKGIMYVEPTRTVSDVAVIDELTRKMTAAFRRSEKGPGFRGFHTCACGANSSNADFTLTNGEKTNSLCIHYLAYHRVDIPKAQLDKVAMLNCGEEVPNEDELSDPRRRNR